MAFFCRNNLLNFCILAGIFSTILFITPINSMANSQVDSLVEKAESTSKVLKWAISIEGTGDGKTRPWIEYNNAKSAYKNALVSINNLTPLQRGVYETSLHGSELQINRAIHYIDAITAGEKITESKKRLEDAIRTKDIDKVVSSYHLLTKEIRKQGVLLDRVYGQSTRDLIRTNYKYSAESVAKANKYDVTVKMELDLMEQSLESNNNMNVVTHQLEVEKFIGFTALFKEDLTNVYKTLMKRVETIPYKLEYVNNKTIKVYLNKPLENLLPAGYFSFNNSLHVTNGILSDDKLEVTLITSPVSQGKEYLLYFKGERTNLAFSTPLNSTNQIQLSEDNIRTLRTVTTGARVYDSTFVNTDGSPYTGKVIVYLTRNGLEDKGNLTNHTEFPFLYSVNTDILSSKDSLDGSKYWSGYTRPDGKISFILFSNKADEVIPVVGLDLNGNGILESNEPKKEVGKSYFYEEASDIEQTVIIDSGYSDEVESYFVIGSGTNAQKYYVKSDDIVIVNGRIATFKEFFDHYNQSATLYMRYNTNESINSIFSILNSNTAPLTIISPSRDVRYDGETYRLLGHGQPGMKISVFIDHGELGVFDKDIDQLVDETIVNNDGSWFIQQVSLTQGKPNHFIAIQSIQGVPLENGMTSSDKNMSLVPVINEGPIKLTSIGFTGNMDGVVGFGDQIDISLLYNDKLYGEDNPTIELVDAIGRKAIFPIGIEEQESKLSLTFRTPILYENNFGIGSIYITSINGVYNQDNQHVDIQETNESERIITSTMLNDQAKGK
ncbi:hypothetical protein IM538_21540 [Cytobacillus suaedae]|nr:hypothetical protein IM538_21540 [Cytobacillus suaedae]